jgi:hypothetical protein
MLNFLDMTTQHGGQIKELLDGSLTLLRATFEARITRVNCPGDVVDLGPDHPKRIAGLHLLTDLCVRGREVLLPRKPFVFKDMQLSYMAHEGLRRAYAAQGKCMSLPWRA